jgi:gas vesicle protein
MNTTTKVILGITAAAVAGAAIGMLLAPEKGTDLQKRIKDGATSWLHEFSSMLNMGKEVVEEVKATAENSFNELSSELIDFDPHQISKA